VLDLPEKLGRGPRRLQRWDLGVQNQAVHRPVRKSDGIRTTFGYRVHAALPPWTWLKLNRSTTAKDYRPSAWGLGRSPAILELTFFAPFRRGGGRVPGRYS
jgi:hypothetical protein